VRHSGWAAGYVSPCLPYAWFGTSAPSHVSDVSHVSPSALTGTDLGDIRGSHPEARAAALGFGVPSDLNTFNSEGSP
jgi:hypothetical protein